MRSLALEYGENPDLDHMCEDHEGLIQDILTEEEELILQHRSHVDSMVDMVKQDMGLLQQVDNPSSDIESYVHMLDASLIEKIN